ncbi:unnamed protein product [Linum trigynum]|uniref:Uncharacterized protein n=1 Tax=Linum trigynum TaxID=586398 RepID=A0AAV2EA38_9ROSI
MLQHALRAPLPRDEAVAVLQGLRLQLELGDLPFHLFVVADPEVLQEVEPARDSVPPGEDLVQVALVAAVVRLDLVVVGLGLR